MSKFSSYPWMLLILLLLISGLWGALWRYAPSMERVWYEFWCAIALIITLGGTFGICVHNIVASVRGEATLEAGAAAIGIVVILFGSLASNAREVTIRMAALATAERRWRLLPNTSLRLTFSDSPEFGRRYEPPRHARSFRRL
jgi:hypothetical protein